MGNSLDIVFLAATRNRFAVVDGFRGAAPEDPVALALALGEHQDVDGLLMLLPPRARGDCRMVLHNLDGSRAEACGNGLRALAKLALDRGHVAGPAFVVETDAGARRVTGILADGKVVAARAEMGAPRIEAASSTLEVDGAQLDVGHLSLGNPHCVLFVEDVEEAPVQKLGPAIEGHPRFPDRTNVAFVEARGDGLAVRVWERGVGETASCGTGVSAAAVIAVRRGLSRSPVEVETRGGRLTVVWDGGDELFLQGPVGCVERDQSEERRAVT